MADINIVTDVELKECRTRDVQGNMHHAVIFDIEESDRPICMHVSTTAVLDMFRDAMAKGAKVTLSLTIHGDEPARVADS